MAAANAQSIDWLRVIDIVITIFLGGIGIYFTHSYQRSQMMRVAEKKLSAYQVLWSKMEIASPYRQTQWISQPLTEKERRQLFDDFTTWYYSNGNGMFLGDSTRAIYLKAKDNLVRDLEFYEPPSIRDELRKLKPKERERARGYLSIRQLSLLRNRMKADLDVFGIPYHINLNDLDKEFLESCGENLQKKPWKDNKLDPGKSGQEIEIFSK